MGSRKSFEPGSPVEIRRNSGDYLGWEPAQYVGSARDWPGWHKVELPRTASPRRINSMTGLDTDENDPQGCVLWVINVPSRRIRKAVRRG